MKKFYFIGGGIVTITFVFYFLVMALINKFPISSETSVWGDFGSYFGGVAGTLLSFLAFIILARTLKLQSITLDLQRDEAIRQRHLSEIELFHSNLERLEKQIDLVLDSPAKSLSGKTIRDILSDESKQLYIANDNIVSSARPTLNLLVYMSFYISEIERQLKVYYSDKNSPAALAFKQYWILKYGPLAKSCLSWVPDGFLDKEKRKWLLDGFGI